MHFFIYLWYAEHREDSYLKSHIIGIDIDGVLNDHRQHFCVLLEKNTGKKIDKEKIITIPVHECPGLGVTREDEQKVFYTILSHEDRNAAKDFSLEESWCKPLRITGPNGN